MIVDPARVPGNSKYHTTTWSAGDGAETQLFLKTDVKSYLVILFDACDPHRSIERDYFDRDIVWDRIRKPTVGDVALDTIQTNLTN